MIQLTTEQATNLRGYLETIRAEAAEMPQVGGNEATIIEQADAAMEILDRELNRPAYHEQPAPGIRWQRCGGDG